MPKHFISFLIIFFLFLSREPLAQSYIEYSRYSGEQESDNSTKIQVINGETYVLGMKATPGYPYTGTQDIIVSKYGVSGELLYSTLLGGNGRSIPGEMKIINDEVYVVGVTTATNYTASVNSHGGVGFFFNGDVVVSKIGVNGAVLFSTYVGGRSYENIIPDGLQVIGNEIFVAGHTQSSNFPITQGYVDTSLYEISAGFITKINALTGTILTSELYMGGPLTRMQVSNGSIFLIGFTYERQLPITIGNYPSQAQSNNFHVYIKKINVGTFNIEYARYLNGSSSDQTYFAVVVNDEVHVTGRTYSNDFPVTNNSTISPGLYDTDAFYTKLNSDGSIGFSTYISTNENDYILGIIVENNEVYLTGYATGNNQDARTLLISKIRNGHIEYLKKFPAYGYSGGWGEMSYSVLNGELFFTGNNVTPAFPITNATQYIDNKTGFFTRLSPAGEILYSTFLGTLNSILPMKVYDNKIYLLGTTNTANFPFFKNNSLAGENDIILIQFNPGSTEFYSTYLGGTANEVPSDFAIENNNIYVSGQTHSINYPVTVNELNQGNGDRFLTKLSFCPSNYFLSNDTLHPKIQTVCKYGLAQLITGNDLTVPSDSLPLLFLNQVPVNQPPISNLIYSWQVATSATGPWTDIPGAVLRDFRPVIGGVNQFYRRLAFSSNDCGSTLINISDTASVLVNALTAPTINLTDPYITCPGSAINIGGSQNISGGNPPYVSYVWDMNLPAIVNPTVSPEQNTFYTLIVTDSLGCQQIGQALVLTYKADAGPDKSNCEGAGVRIGSPPIAGLPNAIYQWTPATNLDNNTIAQPLANPFITTAYELQLTIPKTGGGTCITKDTVRVTPVAAPVTPNFAGTDITLCSGDSVMLGTMAETGFNYTWSPQNYLISIAGSVATFYGHNNINLPMFPLTFTLTAQKGSCYFSDQVDVSLIVSDAGPDKCGPTVIGSPDGTPAINETYSWTKLYGSGNFTSPTNLPQVSVSASVGGDTEYELIVSYNGMECKDQVIITENCGCLINVNAEYFCPSYNVNDGQVTLIAQSGIVDAVYEWTPQQGLSTYTGNIVQLTDDVMRTYTVTAYSANDTSIRCTAEILVNHPSLTKPVFPAPDVFTCTNVPVNIGLPSQPGYTYQWTGSGLSSNTSSNPVATIAGSQQFPVQVTNEGGCRLKDTVVVTVQNVPVNAGPDRVVCSNAIVKLGTPPQPNTTYLWEPQISSWQNGTDQYSAQPEVLLATNATFTVTATSSAGCVSTDDVIISINNTPAIPDAPNITICKGIQKRIGLPAIPDVTYQWSPATGLSDPNIAQPFANPAVTTTYTVVATFPGLCALPATDEVIVTVNDPSFSMPDIYFCPSNGAVALGVNAPLNMSNYYWAPSQLVTSWALQNPSTLTPPPSVPTTFTLQVRNSEGCYYTDTMSIIPTITKPIAGSDRLICKGESISIGSSANVSGPSISYSWSPGINLSNSTIPDPVFTGTTAGIFSYILTSTDNSLSCISRDTVVITVEQVLIPSLNSPTVCMNSCVQIGTQPAIGLQYQWSPASGLSNSVISNPVACVTNSSASYVLTATNANGCNASANVVIGVAPVPAPQVTIPTVEACVGDNNVSFNPSVSGNQYSYLWSPDNGTLSDIYSPTPGITINNPGSFQYLLQITDNNTGCTNTATGNLIVSVCNPFATAGNFVWHDVNSNGLQDPAEPGFSNLTVKLYNNADINVASTITDANGFYYFNYIPPGDNYYVVFYKPLGYAFTLQNVGGVTASDNSKANNFGRSTNFAIAQGELIDNIDAGLISSGTVPVRLLDFTARKQSNSVILNWQTTSEVNNHYFLVERSNDGVNFSNIGRVEGNGTTTGTVNYSFNDQQPLSGLNYYRLKQVDFDGSYNYSIIRSVNFIRDKLFDLYYNNSTSSIHVQFAKPQDLHLKLFAANGQQIMNLSSPSTISEHTLRLPMLSSGIYFVQLTFGNSTYAEKIFINN